MFKRIFDKRYQSLALILEGSLQIQQNMGFSRDIPCQHNSASIQTSNDKCRMSRVRSITNTYIF